MSESDKRYPNFLDTSISRRGFIGGATALSLWFVGCRVENSQTPVVTVEALLANPEAYKNKTVRLVNPYAQFKNEKDNSDEGIGVSSGGGPQLKYTQEFDDYYVVSNSADIQNPNTPTIMCVDSRRGVGQNSSNFAPNPFLDPNPSKIHQFAYIEGIWGNDQDNKINPDGKWYLLVNNAGQELTS